MSARAWRERDHPRHPAKTTGGRGGRFREKWLTGLSGQIAGLQYLRSDGKLQPPGFVEPDPKLLDPEIYAELKLVIDQYSKARVREEFGKTVYDLEDEITSLSNKLSGHSMAPEYAAMVADQQKLRSALETNLERYRRAVRPKMSTAAFKRLLTNKVKKAFAGREVAVRVWGDRLDRMLARGRLTSLHETGRSSGSANTRYRAEYERAAFGIPLDAPWMDRPIYGYLRRTETPTYDDVQQYGDIDLVLKDEVRARITAVFNDSLGSDDALPTPVNDPDWRSWNLSTYGSDSTNLDRTVDSYPYYTEAQIHGGVEVSDIERVVFFNQPPKWRTDALDQAGVKWEVREDGEDQSSLIRSSESDYVYGMYDGLD